MYVTHSIQINEEMVSAAYFNLIYLAIFEHAFKSFDLKCLTNTGLKILKHVASFKNSTSNLYVDILE
jgi:hypothetical protein